MKKMVVKITVDEKKKLVDIREGNWMGRLERGAGEALVLNSLSNALAMKIGEIFKTKTAAYELLERLEKDMRDMIDKVFEQKEEQE